MVMELVLEPQYLMVLYTASMAFVALVILILYMTLKSRYTGQGGEASEVYIGGESPKILSDVTGPIDSLYWAFIRNVGRSLYRYFRDLMHTGRLSDWAGYMSGWYGFLVMLALIMIVYLMAFRGV